jgi:class 3 adenylate cyclase
VRRGEELVVETQYALDGLDRSAPPFTVARGEGATLPMSVVDYVLRTNKPVVLNDLSQPTRFARDAYLATSPPQSLLCLSMSRGGRFESAIYMEHRDASGMFTDDRMEIIRLLASQAMISLENAELYQGQVRLTEAQGRFVPRQFLVSLEQHDIANVGLGEHVAKEMSVLFADVRGFTTLAERLHPKDVIVLLNRYFACLEPSISSAGGFIDSFAGDGLMALFEVGPDNAVDAGIGMCHALDRFNDEGRSRGQPELRVGIGVNTGPLLLGTVGAHGRLQCTVIGDTVNAASRIENLTRTYAARLLVGEQCVDRLGDRGRFSLRELDRVAVKGRTKAFDIYEVLDAEVATRRAQKEATRSSISTQPGASASWRRPRRPSGPASRISDQDPADASAALSGLTSRSALQCVPGPCERRRADRDHLGDVDHRNDVDVVPVEELRDERGDDGGIVGLEEHVPAVVQVRHEGVDREALLGLPLGERLEQRVLVGEVLIVAQARRPNVVFDHVLHVPP